MTTNGMCTQFASGLTCSLTCHTAGPKLPALPARPAAAESVPQHPRKQRMHTLAEAEARRQHQSEISEKKRANKLRLKELAATKQARQRVVANMDPRQLAEDSRLVRQHRQQAKAQAANAKALQQEVAANQRAAAKEAAVAARREAALAKAASLERAHMVRPSLECALPLPLYLLFRTPEPSCMILKPAFCNCTSLSIARKCPLSGQITRCLLSHP